MSDTPNIVMSEVTDPVEMAKTRARHERADRNYAWLAAHVTEVYSKHRGKCICVAGEELFVGDDPKEVVARARAAHPEDDGLLIRYIYKEKLERIYAASRLLASL